MLVSNKHFVPVIGLDIHIVILFGFPIPLPHPYVGFVLDPMDYIPFIGATTKINHVPRGKSDTSGIFVILFHIPMGGPFLLAPMIGHDSVNFFGSKRVKVEGNMMSPSGHMLMTCNDIGIPLSLQPGKKLKPIPSMYLPTSFSIPLSFGKPVMVGGPYVPDWEGVLLNLVMSFGFGALLKGVGKAGKKALTKFNHALKGKIGSNKLSKFLCKKGFEPVDLVQGIVIYDVCDFELPGPIPLQWCRSWNSDSPHVGLLGHGHHLSFEMILYTFEQESVTAVMLGDGRSVMFNLLHYTGEEDYNRHEKMTLRRNNLQEYLLTDHTTQLTYTFTNKQLSTIQDPAGNMISLNYNGNGQLVRIIDSVGRHLHIRHTNGYITQVNTYHRGQEKVMVSYAYNEAGDLSSITDAMGKSTTIRFDDHLMVSKTDRDGQTFYWQYDKKGRCIHTWGDGGLLEGFIAYHPEAGYNLVTNSMGHTYTYYYKPDFVVYQVKDPVGNSRFTEYTDDFEIYRNIDEEGNVTGFTYDAKGNRSSIVKPDGATFSFSYDQAGRMILAADAMGHSRTYIYFEETGLLHTSTETDGHIQIYGYNDKRQLTKIESSDGREFKLDYDEDSNLSEITLPDGAKAQWQYDAWGQCIASRNPLGNEQRFSYDELGRVTDIYMPDGNRVNFTYNSYSNIIRVQDKMHDVHFAYTPLGLLRLREENGSKLNYLYDSEGQLTTVINQQGERFHFIRNARGEVISESGFDGAIMHYERDSTSMLLKILKPGNKSAKYEYDANGMLIRSEYSDGSQETFSYDRNSLLVEAVNEYATVRLERDKTGRVIREWQNGHEVAITFDHLGKRRQVRSSLGADIHVARNITGDIIGMKAGNWEMEVQRNISGQEIGRILPGGLVESRSFDQLSGMPVRHQIQQGGEIIHKVAYRWDVSRKLREIIQSNHVTSFGYDEWGGLAWAQYEDGQYAYRMPDKTGNLFSTPVRNDHQYGPGCRLMESPHARFGYDAEGYLVSKTNHDLEQWQYKWYGNGMLKQVIRPDQKPVSFTYDALGRRISKIFEQMVTRWVWDRNTILHEWTYPIDDRPVTTIDETGNTHTTEELVPPEQLITWVFDGDNFTPLARLQHQTALSVITDYLGTPCKAYDEAGQLRWESELDIYGKVRKLTGDKHLIPFRYQGQYEDAETGLYYNRFRYYSPEEGRYISKDPAGLHGGINQYAYVFDPNSILDIFGLNPEYYPLDNLGRATGGYAEVTPSSLGTGTSASANPEGFVSGNHPTHHQRSHLIAANHGGDGGLKENLVTLTSGSNHPGMRSVEDRITAHVRDGNTVLVEVKPTYDGNNKLPDSVHIFAIDQHGNTIADDVIPNGLYQHHRACGCH